MDLDQKNVFVERLDEAGYEHIDGAPPAELSSKALFTKPVRLVRNLFRHAGLDSAGYGTAAWNPLGDLIRPGDNVLLKPNWVLDKNKLPDGTLECLVTHTSVIEAVLHYVVKAKPKSIIVGDSPVQGCDFDNLRKECRFDDLVKRFRQLGHEIQLRDFRLTKMKGRFDEKIKVEANSDRYSLFDLGVQSWLAPVTQEKTEFRVTCYNPDILRERHNSRSHQYSVARDVLDADVIINLPKLKTHKKAGVTGALKNVVGIIGFKEYLPHHRKGGSGQGGDCYEGNSLLKKIAEHFVDQGNRGKSQRSRYMYNRLARLVMGLGGRIFGDDPNLEGDWYGNDTVWRMCMDVQRILHYGKCDGQLDIDRKRKVITITDAIIAGDGNGPLSPSPVPLGVMTLGTNVAALEWVHCLLMHLDPEKIPLVARSFDQNPWPLADFFPPDIQVHVNGKRLTDLNMVVNYGKPFTLPDGWQGHCEMINTII